MAQKPKTPTVPDETSRDRFLRIGTARMNRVLDHIRLLGNLSSTNYEWSEQDLRNIQEAIVQELSKAMGRFQKTRASKTEFTFEAEAEKL